MVLAGSDKNPGWVPVSPNQGDKRAVARASWWLAA